MWTSRCEQRARFRPKHPLGEMAPWTVGQVLDVALVDELLDVKHGIDHLTESQDTLLAVHPQLCAPLTAHSPSVQLVGQTDALRGPE